MEAFQRDHRICNVTGSRYVVTDPGVLTLLDKNTTMTVKSSSSKDETCVALASTKDAAGWVASEKSYQRISGLTSWTELGVQKGEPTKNQSARRMTPTRWHSKTPICGLP